MKQSGHQISPAASPRAGQPDTKAGHTADPPTPVAALLSAIRALYTALPIPAPITEDVVDILSTTETLDNPIECQPDPTSLQALAWLPAENAGRLGELCALVRSAAEAMPWHYSYGRADGLATRIAFADLVGPGGPFVCDRLRLGLTLVAPHTLYPMHAHPARELYCVVSGVATWTAGAVVRQPRPDEFILHLPDVPHAMQTAEQALLAVYSWRGDIMTPPYYTVER